MSRRLFKPTTHIEKTGELLKTRESDGSEYAPSSFGGHREYFRNRTIKDQNYDAEIRQRAIEAGKPQFFRGCVMACRGETGTDGSQTDLRRIVVEHGGVWINYAAGSASITHLIAEHIRVDARRQFRYTKVVKPSWIYECERAGKRLPEDFLNLGEAGQRKLDLWASPRKGRKATPSPQKFKKGLPSSVTSKARDVVVERSFEKGSFTEPEYDGPPSHQPEFGRVDYEADWMPSYQPEPRDELSDEEPEKVELVGMSMQPKAQGPPSKDSFGSDLFEGIDLAALDPVKQEPTIEVAQSLLWSIQEEVDDSQDEDEPELGLPKLVPSDVIKGEEAYVIEAIVGEKRSRNKRQRPKYLVKWLGYPDSENTWEPEKRLRIDMGNEAFQEMLNAFRARNGRPPLSSDDSEKRRKELTEPDDRVKDTFSTSITTIVDDDLTDIDEPQLPELPQSSQKTPLSFSVFSLPSFSSVHLTPDPEDLPPASQQQEEPSASYPTPKADRQPSGKFAFVNEVPASDDFSTPPISPIARPQTPIQQSQTISPPLSSPVVSPIAPRKRSPPAEENPPPRAKRLNAPAIIETWPGQTAEEFNRAYLNWRPEGWNQSVQNPMFLDQFFKESRLHQLSTWKSELKVRMQAIQRKERPKVNYPRRYVMHIDFDCFFAAVSIRDQPQYANKPVAISHGTSDSSEIASCNYIARSFGVKNGTWMASARKLCPDIVVLPYEFEKYEAASREFYNVVLELDALKVQSVSIDEVLVDITNLVCDPHRSDVATEESRALDLATRVRDLCRQRTRCEVSVGIGANILLAKLALRAAKPAGQHLIRTSDVLPFLSTRKIRDLPGVGPKTSEAILREFGFDDVQRIRQIKPFRLTALLGPKTGQRIHELCNGIDPTPVGASNEVERQSYSINVSWGIRFIYPDQPEKFVYDLCTELERRMKEDDVLGSNLTLNLAVRHPQVDRKTQKWLGCGKVESTSRSAKLMEPTSDALVMGRYAASLLRECNVSAGEIRGLGVAMGKIEMVEKGRMAQRKLGFGVVEKDARLKEESARVQTQPQQQQQQRHRPPRFQPPKPASLMGRFLIPKGSEAKNPLPPQKSGWNVGETVVKKEEQPTTPRAVASEPPPRTPVEKAVTSPSFSSTQFMVPTQVDMSVLEALPESIKAQILEQQQRNMQRHEPPQQDKTPKLESEWDEILKGLATQERLYNQNWEAQVKQQGLSAPSTPSKRGTKRQLHLSPSPHKIKGQVPTVGLTRELPPPFPLFGGRFGSAAAKEANKKEPKKNRVARFRKPRTKNPNIQDPSHRRALHPDGTDVSYWLFSYTHITPDFFHILERQDQITVIRAAERRREEVKSAFEKARNKRWQLEYALERAIRVRIPEYYSRASAGVVWICGERVVGSRFEDQVAQVIREWVREDGWRNNPSRITEIRDNDEEEEDGHCSYGVGCGAWCGPGFWGRLDHKGSHAGPSIASTSSGKDADGNWIWPSEDDVTPEGPEEEHLLEWLEFLKEIVMGERDLWKAVKFVKTFLREAGWKEGWARACERTEEALRKAAGRRGFAGEIVM